MLATILTMPNILIGSNALNASTIDSNFRDDSIERVKIVDIGSHRGAGAMHALAHICTRNHPWPFGLDPSVFPRSSHVGRGGTRDHHRLLAPFVNGARVYPRVFIVS